VTQKLLFAIHDSRQFSEDPSDSGSYIPRYGNRAAPFAHYDFMFQFLNQTRRRKIQYQADLTLPHGHLFTAGADYERESGTVGDLQAGPLEAARDNFGAYFQDQWAFRNRLFTTVGARVEHNDSFGLFAAPRASLALHVHQPAPGGLLGLTKLRGSFGLGIKEPTLVESFSNSPYFRGNPNLLPERSTSFDAGIEQHFGRESGLLEVTFFANRFRDQIGFAITDYTTFAGSFFNIGKSRARGLEAAARQNLARQLEISGAYTLLDSKILVSASPLDPVFAEGQELFRRPRHSGCAELLWKPGDWMLGATAIFAGSRVDSDFMGLGLMRNPGYGVLNLLASYRLGESSSLFVRVNNALNRRYMEVLGYPALRAHFVVGLRAGF